MSLLFFSVDQGLLAGWPSYITQEEFNRYNGFWWCPVKSNTGKIVGFLDTVVNYELRKNLVLVNQNLIGLISLTKSPNFEVL